jgi:hypothetical protein
VRVNPRISLHSIRATLAAGAAAAPLVGTAFPNPKSDIGDLIGGTALTGAAGGFASVAGGGKFENGAVTAAFGYMYNHALGSNKPVRVTDDSGTPVLNENGEQMLTPEGADPHIFVNLGLGDREVPGAIGFNLVAFWQGGPLDVQRNLGSYYRE